MSKDGIAYTKDFDVKFLTARRRCCWPRSRPLTGQAVRLEDEANSLIEDGEMGDVEFDDEGGEGDTMVVERERDLALSAQARQTIADIDAALERMADGTYGYSIESGTADPARAPRGDPVGDRAGRGEGRRDRPSMSGEPASTRPTSPPTVRVTRRAAARPAAGDRRRGRPARPAHQALGAERAGRRRPSTSSGRCGSTCRSTAGWPSRRPRRRPDHRRVAIVVIIVLALSVRRAAGDAGSPPSPPAWSSAGRSATSSTACSAATAWLHGAVIDFIDLQWFPIFNVADAADHHRRRAVRRLDAAPAAVTRT